MAKKNELAVKWLEDKAEEYRAKVDKLSAEISQLAAERDRCELNVQSLRNSAAIMKANGSPELMVKAPKPANVVPLQGTAKMAEITMRAGPPKNVVAAREVKIDKISLDGKERLTTEPIEQPRAMIWSCNRCAHEFKSPNRPGICENERCNGKSFTMLR
jgi:hypothetical protein